MYSFFIALYMGLSVWEIYKRLASVEGGVAAFSRLQWVLLVLAVLMVPLTILMLCKAFRDVKASTKEKKDAVLEEQRREHERRVQELYVEDGEDELDILRRSREAAGLPQRKQRPATEPQDGCEADAETADTDTAERCGCDAEAAAPDSTGDATGDDDGKNQPAAH